MGRIRLLLLLLCISPVLWIAFAKLVVPPLIESAYRGESLLLLNNMIKGQQEHSLSYYFEKWDSLTLRYLLNGLGLWLLILAVSSPAPFRRFVEEATPGSARRASHAQSSQTGFLGSTILEIGRLGARTGFDLRAAYDWSDLGLPHLG
jgi:hypothetical protein